MLGLEFLENIDVTGNEQRAVLQDVADKCLLFSGLFPGRAKKCRVRISYFVDLGQSAYATLSSSHASTSSELFIHLAENFVVLMDVLFAMRQLEDKAPLLEPIEAQELFADTGSEQARKNLEKYTDAFSVYQEIPDDLKKED